MIMRTPNGESTDHPLSEHPLQEVGPRRRDTLERAGFTTLEALAQADPGEMAALQGMYLSLAHRTIARAIERLEMLRAPGVNSQSEDDLLDDDTAEMDVPVTTQPVPQPVVHQPPRQGARGSSKPTKKKQRKGRPPKEVRALSKALLERIARAKRHAAEATAKKERRRAREHLGRLHQRLEQLRARKNLGGVTATEWARTQRLLQAVNTRLEKFLDRRPKRGRLQKLTRQTKRATRSLPTSS